MLGWRESTSVLDSSIGLLELLRWLTAAAGSIALLIGILLGPPHRVEDQTTGQTRTGPGDGSEPRVAADCSENGADPSPSHGSGERALLRRRHVGTTGEQPPACDDDDGEAHGSVPCRGHGRPPAHG